MSNTSINLEKITTTLQKINAEFTIKIKGLGTVEIDLSLEHLPDGLKAQAQAEISKSLFDIGDIAGNGRLAGGVTHDNEGGINFSLQGAVGGSASIDLANDGLDYSGSLELATCIIEGKLKETESGGYSLSVNKKECEPGEEIKQALEGIKKVLEYNPHAGEDMSNTSNDGSDHSTPSELPINDTVINPNDFHQDEAPTPVRGRDDSDWGVPGANDTDTNDGTIDGEGGGPPPLADVDWDSLEQTASNGDQASDVIYDADLEQTPPTTPDDLLAGGSPDDAFANPEPPESSFIDAVGDTLEDIGDAIEEAWEDRGAQAVGAAASASFMTYANLNGWTEEDWLDESHEQSIASFVVNEVAQDIVTFDFSAGDFNLFEWSGVNADGQAVAGTGANMIALLAAGEIASELGLGGTDLASTVGTSMAISGMQYTLSTGEITAQIQPHAPPRLCFSVREPLKVNNNWGQVVETPRLGEARTVAVRQGQTPAPLGAKALWPTKYEEPRLNQTKNP